MAELSDEFWTSHPIQRWLKPPLGPWPKKLYDEHVWRIYKITVDSKGLLFHLQSILTDCRGLLSIEFASKPYMIAECCINIFEQDFCDGTQLSRGSINDSLHLLYEEVKEAEPNDVE